MIAGIDFGTTNSVVAQWAGGDVEVLALDGEHLEDEWFYPSFESLFPTVVGESSARLGTLFGWEAKLQGNRVIEACKRMLRSDGGIQLRDRRVSATAVAAGVFQAMRERAERNLTSIDSAVITVPANAKGGARYRTRAAARAAGIEVKALLNESTAAALSYMHDVPEEGTVMVFDWGGGTIDVTVLEHQDGIFEERASRGITQLGGLEIDKRLRELLVQKMGRTPELSDDDRRQFDLAVERTKIRLSTEESVLTRVPGNGRLIEVTRAELEGQIADLVERALEPARMCLNDLGIGPTGITDILMIGGTSQMPCVRAAVERLMDAETVPAHICHPMTAVARGAAIAAAILNKELDSFLQVSSMYALGTTVRPEELSEPRFSTIIPPRSPLPAVESKNYKPNRDFAEGLKLEIWEADPDKPLDHPENFQLTTLAVRFPRPAVRDDSTFTLEYTYQENGLLHVKAIQDRDQRVLLDQEITDFTHGQTLTVQEIQREMRTLDVARPAPSAFSPQFTEPTEPWQPVRPRKPVPTPTPQTVRPIPVASPQTAARRFVVDGSNIAWLNRDVKAGDKPSFTALCEAVEALKAQNPGCVVDIVVDAALAHQLPHPERRRLEKGRRSGEVTQVPAGTAGKADRLVCTVAERTHAVIVTNDSFKELQSEFSWLCDEGRLLGASYVGGEWVFLERRPVRPRRDSLNGG
ncbi:heat-shock protein Hsp70 [Actinomadura logoneensis]|uniref:Heat-shock protein Hsp70 n=1 Tax=Actinomadura logoneensis TaxID=2293572 RepID=A0A372JJF4_9ACTN|nr:Hsp70 family protein [Actinomadura logoneensis]RFU39428.1 heat-shock protein Hsp70 [Actinomadura logoneensis]